jgi:CBS-domain-containing membrane protein
MSTHTKSFMKLTASDVMSRDVVRFPEDMPLPEAAQILVQKQLSGAPVVDAWGRCVGVLSLADFASHFREEKASRPVSRDLPLPCVYLNTQREPHGEEVFFCTLTPEVCPFQIKEKGPNGKERFICSQPRCVFTDWQMVSLEELPADVVRRYMTTDPVTANLTTPLRQLARRMIDAHIHRIVVVDPQQRPVGLVSSTDIMAAVAYDNGGSRARLLARAEPEVAPEAN